MSKHHQHSRTCPECGTSFSCSANQQCWCIEMPAVLPLEANLDKDSCYCQACLSKRVAAQLEQLISSSPHSEALAKAAKYAPSSSAKPSLQEHIDYEPESQEFTAWYHLKRGYCCDSACKHCPYPDDQN